MMSCSDYDYIEIVCMGRYPIRMYLVNGDVLDAIAIDTKRNIKLLGQANVACRQ
ncbi:Rho-binding antiterminator [Vibrio splendidus]|uniref:Rho-binding antiterminator n=2 Tax=Vibrio splendidus TaxID=29497 RepID=UPI000C852AD0